MSEQLTPEQEQVLADIKLATEHLLQDAQELSLRANAMGFVLTIETLPRKPLAMGNYDSVATLRLSHAVYRD